MRRLILACVLTGCGGREAPPEPPEGAVVLTRPVAARRVIGPEIGPSRARALEPEVAEAMRAELAGLPSATTEVEVGRRDAMATILDGRLMLEGFGSPSLCDEGLAEILLKEYAIVLARVAGCEVEAAIVDHARGFNEVMEREIARRHGPDALAEAARRAGC
jgi:hypothetical protein